MGALDEGHFCSELENGVNLGGCCVGLEFEQEPETLAIEDAVKVLLLGLGDDINREGIRKTPNRVAKALREGTRGYKQKVKDIVQDALFPEAGLDSVVGHAGGVGGLVVVRDLDLFSYCESCLLPFQVKCHVGYVPSGQKVVGLSKLSRVADIFAKRLQAPQRLADEICLALQNEIKPTGVAVVLQCSHLNFPSLESAFLESNHQGWVKAIVTSGSGAFEDEKADIWDDFLCLSKLRGVSVEKTGVSDESWCPAQSCSKTSLTNSGMVAAVASIIRSVGEDPSRKELVETPIRFVKWLMNFKNCNFDMKLNGFGGTVKSGFGGCGGDDCHIQSELNLTFWSQCEHHLLPFHGVVHIGYISSGGGGANPIGVRPLLQSIVHFYGFKLQVQERLTRQIAETASSLLGGNVMVVVDANHTCMISRGIEKFGSSTSTLAVLGCFSTESAVRAKFRRILPSSECS